MKGFAKSCFPSWTWAGWDSPAELGSYFFITGLRREINWYLINGKGVAILMATQNTAADTDFTECDERKVSPQCQLPDYLLAVEQPRLEVDADQRGLEISRVLSLLDNHGDLLSNRRGSIPRQSRSALGKMESTLRYSTVVKSGQVLL